ncbi:MAG: hypothetical protein JWQ61_231 [Collimonas fungivorans]|uniref:DUF3566 domain-containing protein n=1 Tax=Collimonas fungivorans TaxID=158899 RepID=UPI0026F14A02|nr:DUF3566 domain-containing protein [Collimonas fungivorans]MDB5765417.1 hypothetical protein [Collimonas fungivorans]
MKKQILSISPVQTAKVVALLYFAISFPIFVLMSLFFLIIPGNKAPAIGAMIALPFIYLVVGFVFTVIGAWVYNLIAKWVGGIEFTTSDIENS